MHFFFNGSVYLQIFPISLPWPCTHFFIFHIFDRFLVVIQLLDRSCTTLKTCVSCCMLTDGWVLFYLLGHLFLSAVSSPRSFMLTVRQGKGKFYTSLNDISFHKIPHCQRFFRRSFPIIVAFFHLVATMYVDKGPLFL